MLGTGEHLAVGALRQLVAGPNAQVGPLVLKLVLHGLAVEPGFGGGRDALLAQRGEHVIAAGRLAPGEVTTQLAPLDDAPAALRRHALGGDTKTILVA